MALSVDPLTYIVSVPKADLTLVSGTIYEHDTDAFRLELKAWEDDVYGINQPKTHDHNTEVVIAGVTYARAIEVLAPYSVEYEDGQYTVLLVGSNNNIFDVLNNILVQNQVQVVPSNSAGLIVTSPGTILESEKQDIAKKVWDKDTATSNLVGSFGYLLQTTIPGLLNTIINNISSSTRNAINTVTRRQPNQK